MYFPVNHSIPTTNNMPFSDDQFGPNAALISFLSNTIASLVSPFAGLPVD